VRYSALTALCLLHDNFHLHLESAGCTGNRARGEDHRRAGDLERRGNTQVSRGLPGIAAYTLLGTDHGNGDYARSRLKEAGVDGVVVMRPISKDQRVTYTPGGTSSTFGSYYGGFGSYYGYGWQTTYSPGSVRTDTVVAVETLIYSLKDDKLLWAGTSHTTNPANLSELVTEVADAVAKQAARQGLIAR
jgi:hypothetical protein